MAEAEGVLLDWAWRGIERLMPHVPATVVAPAGVDLSELRKELDVFLAAVFDRRFEIIPRESSRRSRWSLAWNRRVPWSADLVSLPATDGSAIHLPRTLSGEDAGASRAQLRLMALALAARIERGSLAELPFDPLARDLYWALDGVRACAWLCGELPGLRTDLQLARDCELARRRVWRRPTPLEACAEQWMRGLLRGDPLTGPERPHELARWADAQARCWRAERGGAYRGVAPLRYLGTAIELCTALRDVPGGAQRSPGGLRSRDLRVGAESLPPEPERAREAPWLVPGGDPLLSAEPTSRTVHPLDREAALDLEALADELERFDAIPRVRSAHTVHEVLESEAARPSTVRAATDISQTADVLVYPEWDYRAGHYRTHHCRVRERLGSEGDPGWPGRVLGERAALVRALRSQTEALRPRLEQQPRQLEGDEIDLDAYVEHRSERLRSRGVAERVYRSERRLRRDFAVALVLDASASTERSLAERTRVLDLEKEAALLFCVATRWLGDRCAVYAFASRGAKAVQVQKLKGFDEPHGAAVERRIAALEPADCTRLGAALRHVQHRLCAEQARARLLLILSDGRPSDDDGYDGRYGCEDTRRAVHEAVQRGLVPFCLSIQPDPDAHLDRVFGPARHARLLTPLALPERLAAAYRELTRRT